MNRPVVISEIALIAAVAENRVVGDQGQLPWRLPADLRYFKSVTEGKVVIMGRVTYDSIGKPLPNRKNFVVTRQADPSRFHETCHIFNTLSEAISAARIVCEDEGTQEIDLIGQCDDGPCNDEIDRVEKREIMIIGGAQIYREALPLADRIYLTQVHATPKGDAYFPALNLNEWKQVSHERHVADEKNQYDYSFVVLDRVSY